MVTIHELIAWGLDDYSYRNSGMSLDKEEFAKALERAEHKLSERACYEPCNALMEAETKRIYELLSPHVERDDVRQEYDGLEWSVGVVDLRHVLAFQRRLVFDPEVTLREAPLQNDWPRLVSLALGSQRSTECTITSRKRDEGYMDVTLESRNPDLQIRLSPEAGQNGSAPLFLYGGGPFFEVAEFRGRWFLRDGYHRAYGLLQAGVFLIPAVVIRTRTIEELGATQPWFFSEEQLLSARPPRVMDFLENHLVLRYQRPRLIKTIRIRIEESLQPIRKEEEVQGDDL